MRTFKGQMRALGYSNEALWAYERNRELLRRMNQSSTKPQSGPTTTAHRRAGVKG